MQVIVVKNSVCDSEIQPPWYHKIFDVTHRQNLHWLHSCCPAAAYHCPYSDHSGSMWQFRGSSSTSSPSRTPFGHLEPATQLGDCQIAPGAEVAIYLIHGPFSWCVAAAPEMISDSKSEWQVLHYWFTATLLDKTIKHLQCLLWIRCDKQILVLEWEIFSCLCKI